MTFRLYTSSDESIAISTETHADVAVVDGVLTVSLGRITELSSIMTHDTALWLGVQIDEGVEMQPRMRVGGALKAQWAQSADHARDVRGEVIHPRSVHIGDQPVIDEAGRMGGESTGLRGPQGEPGAMGETGVTTPPAFPLPPPRLWMDNSN